MKIGVAIPHRDWPDASREWSYAEMAEYGVRAEEVGFDSLWASDHFFLELGAPRLSGGPEPLILLSYLAGLTQRVELGTLVLCAAFRSPGQLVREAKTLHAVSGGRFILGLGAGWHEPEFAAFDIPFDHLVSRFEEYVDAVVALLGDRRVDRGGSYVRLRGAEVRGGSVPPIWIASGGPRMLRLTGKHAIGWNPAGPGASFPNLLQILRREEVAAGRPEGSILASSSACALIVAPEEAERLLAEYPPLLGSVAVGPDGLKALVEERRAAGCGHLIVHFSGGIWSSYGPEQLDLAAEALGLRTVEASPAR
jgi:alkanesulfonate monooxygenase SsuD/methylene tetrahydromethanopterin reductase-like flavin-dependent oxidoreductase (luciferase family)